MEPRVACLKVGSGAGLALGDRMFEVADEQALIDSGANAFLLDGYNPSAALAVIERVRRTPRTSLAPVFYTHPQGARFLVLADRLVENSEQLLSMAQTILSAIAELNIAAVLQSCDFRLLAWLYTRRNEELLPVADPFRPGIYSYPVAECFAEEEINISHWLHNLQAQGQLASGRLIDRIRLCPECGCSHLNYVDVCPSCRSIAISQKTLVHCFSCGRIGNVDEFTKGNSLRCPFCNAHLRKPGGDYDQPAESFICMDCDGHFAEPVVIAVCYGCGSGNSLQELHVRTFHSYRLTEKGQISARVGRLEVAYSLLDQLGNVSPTYFSQFLNWHLNLTRRYPNEVFTLLALRLLNVEETADALGTQRATQLIDNLVARLKELLRTTDVSVRLSPDTLWLLLPRTPGENGEIVRKRILELNGTDVREGTPQIQTHVERFTFPTDTEGPGMRDSINARDLIFRLNARLSEDS